MSRLNKIVVVDLVSGVVPKLQKNPLDYAVTKHYVSTNQVRCNIDLSG